mmetsp:Transcript_8349/g.23689  ORF Transcript_8349/g.23689 Transcript_8349/m.23689 type:complete len:242 (+) Transcript_8349:183-908(+)
MTSQSPSVARTKNSSISMRDSTRISGTATTDPASSLPLCWTSPKDRDTASIPFTRFDTIRPPAFSIRWRSSSLVRRWSDVRSTALPPLLNTHRQSPTFPTMSWRRRSSRTAMQAVDPHSSSFWASLRQTSRSTSGQTLSRASEGEARNRRCFDRAKWKVCWSSEAHRAPLCPSNMPKKLSRSSCSTMAASFPDVMCIWSTSALMSGITVTRSSCSGRFPRSVCQAAETRDTGLCRSTETWK